MNTENTTVEEELAYTLDIRSDLALALIEEISFAFHRGISIEELIKIIRNTTEKGE